MTVLLNYLGGNQFITEMLMTSLVMISPHEKRKNSLFRIIIFCITAELIAALVMNVTLVRHIWKSPEYVVISSTIYVFVFAMLSAGFVCFCCPVSIREAIYCAALTLCIQHFASALQLLLDELIPGKQILLDFFLWAGPLTLICCLSYFFCIRYICLQGTYQVSVLNLTTATCLIFLTSAFISIAAKGFNVISGGPLFLISQVYEMLCCLFLLWIQVNQIKTSTLQQDLEIQNYLQHLRREQFQQSKADMDLLTHLMHNLTHQIAKMISEDRTAERDEILLQIEKNLVVYDKAVNTNNETLNTVLLERNLFCRANHISWMVVADGERLDFIRTEDLYLIFRNLLDNAIEAVCKLEDIGRRIIDVRVFSRNHLLMIQVQNDFVGRLRFENGLPQTTKGNPLYHGFGLKTVQKTIEQYGGQMTIQVKQKRFVLQIIISIPM